MKRIYGTILFSTFIVLLFFYGTADTVQDEFSFYKQLNDKELRLSEYKDSDESLKIKIEQLGIINASRKKFRAQPVKLDILASRVANRQCREAAENKYVSHWNLAGEKPYQRYAFAGGYDHVSENAFGEWTDGSYSGVLSTVAAMMNKGHQGFMKERAPNDGHKKNIIEKTHNYVGIGFYLSENQFRYYEEFIDRYVDFSNIPAKLKVNEQSSVTVDTKGSSYLYFILVYYEKYPQPMKVSQLTRTGSYQDYTNEVYLKIPAWDLATYRNGNIYRIPVKFSKEGLYYIHIFTDASENTGSRSLNTKGKTPVSGIVIRVDK